jgi:hypothetical protein
MLNKNHKLKYHIKQHYLRITVHSLFKQSRLVVIITCNSNILHIKVHWVMDSSVCEFFSKNLLQIL